MEKYRILVIERERGWGGDEWYEFFDTVDEARARMNSINAKNTSLHAPDYYVMAQGPVEKVFIGKHAALDKAHGVVVQ